MSGGAAQGCAVPNSNPSSPMDLTTAARVKALLGLASNDTVDNTALGALISSVSRRIERHLHRELQSGVERTEVFDCWPDTDLLLVEAYPIASIASVTKAEDQDWAEGTGLVEGTGYVLHAAEGRLYRPNNSSAIAVEWPRGVQSMRVVYTGGIAADTDAFVAAEPDIAHACESQVVEEWRRRTGMAATTRTVQGTTATHEGAVRLLPLVQEILEPYRRVSW